MGPRPPGSADPEPQIQPWGPSEEGPDPTQPAQDRHRLLVGVLAVLIPLAVLITVFVAMGNQRGWLAPGPVVGSTATLVLIVAYGIARRGHVDVAAALAVATAFAGCTAIVALDTAFSEVAGFAFFGVPLAMSSLLFPAWVTGLISVGAIFQVGFVSGDWFLRGTLVFLGAMVGGLLTMGSYLLTKNREQIAAQAQDLARSQTWLREAQRVSKVGAFSWEPGSKPWWSPEVYRLLGYQPGEVEPSLELVREHVHPEDREQFERDLEAAMEGPDSEPIACRIVCADDETIQTLWKITANGSEENPRFVGAVQDVTDRKENEALERRVAVERARTRSLQRAVQIASHEFREPIRAVMTSVQRVARDLDADGSTQKELGSIQASADRLRHVTDALVNFTETLARPLDPEPIDLREALEAARADLEARRDTDVPLQADTLPGVWADWSFIVTVFEELLANTLDHGQPPVTVEAEDAGDRWRIRIRDEGEGIPPAYTERAFQPFERLGREGWEQHPGLGLTLARRIVERHGGTMVARALPEGGTEILFSLPRAESETSSTSESPQTQVDPARL